MVVKVQRKNAYQVPIPESKIKAGQTPSFFPEGYLPPMAAASTNASPNIFKAGQTPSFLPTSYLGANFTSQAQQAVTVNVNAPIYGVQDVQRLIIDSVNQAQKNGTTTVLPNAGR